MDLLMHSEFLLQRPLMKAGKLISHYKRGGYRYFIGCDFILKCNLTK
ncbi:MAG: hypothetical protein ACJAT7_002361 [Psychromonas sp.]|jgi:hypothetical protein